MNNLSSYFGLVDARISASDKYLPCICFFQDFSTPAKTHTKKISKNGTTFFSDLKHQLLSEIQILLRTKGKSPRLTQHKIHLDDLATAYLRPLA